jgi:hypothetical protein
MCLCASCDTLFALLPLLQSIVGLGCEGKVRSADQNVYEITTIYDFDCLRIMIHDLSVHIYTLDSVVELHINSKA